MSHLDYLSRRIGYTSYAEYLKSDHWKFFSSGMKAKKCFCCRSRKTLQVHHLHYRNLGKELPPDVITVCNRCHVAIHDYCKGGGKLENAHMVVRNQNRKSRKDWVHLGKLMDEGNHPSLPQLLKFLDSHGLIQDGFRASEKAVREGFAKRHAATESWSIGKYKGLLT